MATLVIPNTVQIVVEMACSGQQVINVLHFKTGVGTFTNGNEALAAFKTAWERAAGPLKIRSSLVTMVGYKFTDISSLNGAVASLSSNVAGSGAATISTMASSALVKFGGGTRSRSSSGRLYHGPLLETDVNADGRTLAAASATAITAAYNTLDTEMAAQGLQLAVASRKNSESFDVGSISTANVIATQRRRLR
jgi:hypothetical protein